MKAVVFDAGRPVLVDRPDPVPGPGEAVVRVTLAGICGTDLEIVSGEFGSPPPRLTAAGSRQAARRSAAQ